MRFSPSDFSLELSTRLIRRYFRMIPELGLSWQSPTSSSARPVSLGLRAGSRESRIRLETSAAHSHELSPSEPDDEEVEDGEQGETNRRVVGQAIDLVDHEAAEERKGHVVRPVLTP